MSIEPAAGVLALAFVVPGCAGAQRPTPHPLQPLAESRALDVIDSAFAQMATPVRRGTMVDLSSQRRVPLDVAAVTGTHGVEYLTPSDRTIFAAALPQRHSPDALLIMQARTGTSPIEILVLDAAEYRFEPDPERASAERPTQLEVEDRLRRAVVDYLTYLRQQRLAR